MDPDALVLSSYGGIFELGTREYTLDDFHALQLDKLERFVCLKPSGIVIPKEAEESSDEEGESEGEESDEEEEEDEDSRRESESEDEKEKEKKRKGKEKKGKRREVESEEEPEGQVEARVDAKADAETREGAEAGTPVNKVRPKPVSLSRSSWVTCTMLGRPTSASDDIHGCLCKRCDAFGRRRD